ncbi:MAG: tRNA (adenosine(37)-N6)-dimethylallyltransferase MiaA [Bacteriovoracia bacterium]
MKTKNIIVISGATATGKTDLSLKVAQQFSGEIINCDSLQFYKELNIGTAKPSTDELNACTHHMINCASITNPINAAQYVKQALPIIEEIHKKNQIAIIVGGSGFYLQALLEGMYPADDPDPEIIKKSEDLYQREGIDPFIKILKDIDPPSFERLHPNDHYRIRRAVEYYWITGISFSKGAQTLKDKKQNQSKNSNDWNIFHCYLEIPKDLHWEIMKKRTEKMIEKGLVEEVKDLLKQGFTGKEKPMQSIGYKEALAYLNGLIPTQDDLIEKIYIATRRLAKSQKTWFKSKRNKTKYNPLIDQTTILNDLNIFLKNE